MARPTIASLTAALEASRTECGQLRKLNAEWACQSKADKIVIMRLKSGLPAHAPNTRAPVPLSQTDAFKAFFAANPGAKSVTPAQLKEYA